MWLSCPLSLSFLFPVTNLIKEHTRYNNIYSVLMRIFTVSSPFNVLGTIYLATDKQNDHIPVDVYVLLLARNITNVMSRTNFLCLDIHHNIPLDLLSEFLWVTNLHIDLLASQWASHSVMFVRKLMFVVVHTELDMLRIQAACNEFSKYC
jgi:hypothetical protein